MQYPSFLIPLAIVFLIGSSIATALSPVDSGQPGTNSGAGNILLLRDVQYHTGSYDSPVIPGIVEPVLPMYLVDLPDISPWQDFPVNPVSRQPYRDVVPLVHQETLYQPSVNPALPPDSTLVYPAAQVINRTGTIRWMDLEGGFFGITGDDGAQYLPLNLGEKYRLDGTRVLFSGYLLPGTPTIQMWGIPVQITGIREIPAIIKGTGTIRWIDLEGGFFGIVDDDGAQYLPLNLGEEYQVDGLHIRFSAYPAEGMTMAMWGTPVILLSINDVDDTSAGVLITYRRSGGIAGFQDELIVFGDGTAIITRKGTSQVIRLTGSEWDALVLAGEEAGFPGLFTEYLPEEGACDLFFYEVTWKGITVRTADTAVPASLAPMIDILNRIVAYVIPR